MRLWLHPCNWSNCLASRYCITRKCTLSSNTEKNESSSLGNNLWCRKKDRRNIRSYSHLELMDTLLNSDLVRQLSLTASLVSRQLVTCGSLHMFHCANDRSSSDCQQEDSNPTTKVLKWVRTVLLMVHFLRLFERWSMTGHPKLVNLLLSCMFWVGAATLTVKQESQWAFPVCSNMWHWTILPYWQLISSFSWPKLQPNELVQTVMLMETDFLGNSLTCPTQLWYKEAQAAASLAALMYLLN